MTNTKKTYPKEEKPKINQQQINTPEVIQKIVQPPPESVYSEQNYEGQYDEFGNYYNNNYNYNNNYYNNNNNYNQNAGYYNNKNNYWKR